MHEQVRQLVDLVARETGTEASVAKLLEGVTGWLTEAVQVANSWGVSADHLQMVMDLDNALREMGGDLAKAVAANPGPAPTIAATTKPVEAAKPA